MSFGEVAVVVCGLLLGYWIVSMFTSKRPSPPVDCAPPEAESSAGATAGAWHDVLGISAEAGADEIRTAYRELLSQYHPDKVASLGPELRELAKRKTQEIIDAYRVGMLRLGVEP